MSNQPINPTSSDAADALRRGRELDQTVRSRSGWYRSYLLTYALATTLLALIIGLGPSPTATVAALAAWAAVIGGLTTWSKRQPVNRAGFARRHGTVIAVWTALWGGVVIPGSIWFHGNPAWWVPGALITAVPALVVYWRERMAVPHAAADGPAPRT